MRSPPTIDTRRLGDPADDGQAKPEVTLDVVGFREAERRALKAVLAEMGRQLGVRFSFGGASSEVLVLEATQAMGMPLAARETLQAGRPLVLVMSAELVGGLRRAHDGRDLLNQLRRLPQVSARAA
ncbi:MAG: hypothetical protein IPM99_02515 [Rubrivivax sp.]|jgi:hypothetical protein|nr:hypothetical protein [Rubrivivax sp.]